MPNPPLPTTAAAPPSRSTLNSQIVASAAGNQQAAVAKALEQLGPHLDLINAATGQNFVLAVAAYTPQAFPRMRTKGTLQAIATDAASDGALLAQGYA